MKISSHDLDDWRKFAAAKTHGPSDEACHALAWRMAVDEKPLGRVLEPGFGKPLFAYSGNGRIPKLTRWRWQDFLLFLRGRIFSDNFGIVVRK